MDHQQGNVESLAVELRVIEPAVLLELLAMVGGDHHGDVAREAEPFEVREKAPQDVVGLADAGVVERLEMIDHRLRRPALHHVPAGERRPRGPDVAGGRRTVPEQVLILLRRVVRRVEVKDGDGP